MKTATVVLIVLLLASVPVEQARATASTGAAGESTGFARDRWSGLAMSVPGTYVRHGEWVAAVAYETLSNRGYQYAPQDFGFEGAEDHLGELTSSKGVLYVGYGVSDRVAVGMKLTFGEVRLRKAADDHSDLPRKMDELGVIEIEPEVTWKLMSEGARHPEVYAYAVVAVPHDTAKDLIGTKDWMVLPGIGVAKGFSMCTLSARWDFEYDAASESPLDFGSWAVEAERRFAQSLWVLTGLEGQVGGSNNFEEVWLVSRLNLSASPFVAVAFGSRLGLTAETEGWTLDIGLFLRSHPL